MVQQTKSKSTQPNPALRPDGPPCRWKRVELTHMTSTVGGGWGTGKGIPKKQMKNRVSVNSLCDKGGGGPKMKDVTCVRPPKEDIFPQKSVRNSPEPIIELFVQCLRIVPGDPRPGAAVVPVDPRAVPAGLLVAPRVREAAVLARVRARLAVRSQTELGAG